VIAGGAVVVAARGRNHGRTAGASRGATGATKAYRDLRCWSVGCRSRGTYSGEVGPNGGKRGIGLTKKIEVS
jgi:hypothetical protein